MFDPDEDRQQRLLAEADNTDSYMAAWKEQDFRYAGQLRRAGQAAVLLILAVSLVCNAWMWAGLTGDVDQSCAVHTSASRSCPPNNHKDLPLVAD